jgi:hypothetical protein
MNRTTFVFVAVVLLLLIGVAIFYWQNPAPKAIRLELTGTAGTRVTGSYDVDAAMYPIDGVLPLNIEVTGKHFEYSAKKAAEDGELSGALIVEGARMGHSVAQGPQLGVRGHYTRTAFSESAGFTTFSQDKE